MDIEQIFDKAVEITDPAKRAAYIDQACQGDQTLRSKVEKLLRADGQIGDFLESAPIDQNVTLDMPHSIDGPGTKIGRYELLELIGEGGMGLVYLAEQKRPVKRRVALKIVKPGMDSKQVIARFEAERQALALLDHPNVAHVFDAGTTNTGRPYFVMEYVKGMTITRYCDERKFSIEQRLRLFEQVCEGIHHAHQKGIIHRDLKPSNILVTVHGDKSVPKIIDFGIAKAITQPLTGKTFVTYQGQVLGTPEYMSPEQVDLATQDIDVRSDIYSLGVVLYELLTGVLPFESGLFEKIGFAEIQKTIREQEPLTPSTKLTSLGKEARSIAESRRTQVLALAKRLHRELEWIPLKAMRKDRCRRYRSASEMADDMRNYLSGLPLIAGPETAVYRIQKFVHKHAGSVTMTVLVILAIIIGLATSSAMYLRAERALKRETEARNRAEQAEAMAQKQRVLAEQRAEDYRRELYINRVALAENSLQDAHLQRARELLDLCPSDLRGWEWYHLWRSCHLEVKVLEDHEGSVYSAVVSPNGKLLASTSWDKTIRVWDLLSYKELQTLRGHKERALSIAFSPDNTQIVSGDLQGVIKIWDVNTGSELLSLSGHDAGIWSVAYNPSGTQIASSSMDKTIKLWQGKSGDLVTILQGHDDMVGPIVFSHDGKTITSGSKDKTIKVWDIATGRCIRTLYGHEGGVTSIALSKNSSNIVSGGTDGTIRIWAGSDGTQMMTLKGHRAGWNMRTSVAISPEGDRIVSGSLDNTIKVWDVATGDQISRFVGHFGGVTSVAFSADGRNVISTGDNAIKFWDTAGNTGVTQLSGHTAYVSSLAFSPDGECLASASHDKTIKIWQMAEMALSMTLSEHKDVIRKVIFRPDGSQLASSSRDGVVKIWDVRSGKEILKIQAHDGEINSIAYSPDGERLASVSTGDRVVRIWDVKTGENTTTLQGLDNFGYSVAFSPNGKYIAAGAEEGMVKIWDVNTELGVRSLRRSADEEYYSVYSLVFTQDSTKIIAGGEKTKIWDIQTGKEIGVLGARQSHAWSIALLPDEKRIIGGADDLKIWDVDTGRELLSIDGYDNPIRSVAISPEGNLIAGAGSDNGLIRIWRCATSEEVATWK